MSQLVKIVMEKVNCNDSEEIVLDTKEETGSTDAGSIFNSLCVLLPTHHIPT